MYNALDDLREIGTPKAALVLVPFIWHEDKDLASRAALNFATLLPKPDVENALRGYLLTEEQRKADWYKWVWEPFNKYEPDASSLPVIAGRIDYLIDKLSERDIVNFEKVSNLEPRIITPLIVQDQTKWKGILETVIKKAQQPKEEFVKLKSILENKYTPPTLDDWKNVFSSNNFVFEKSWYHHAIVLVISFVLFIVVVEFPLFTFIITKNLDRRVVTTILGLYFVHDLIENFLSFYLSLGILLAIVLIFFLILKIGLRKEREAKNPLHGLLEPPKTSQRSMG